jgi:hypothetical protein
MTEEGSGWQTAPRRTHGALGPLPARRSVQDPRRLVQILVMPVDGMDEIYKLTCPRCQRQFQLCGSCFRGHRYCSRECSQAGREESKRRARHRYGSSPRGRQKACERQRRHRVRARRDAAETASASEGVTDQSSHPSRPAASFGQGSATHTRSWRVRGPLYAAPVAAIRTVLAERDGRCERCAREGHLLVVPRGWVRRRYRFVAPEKEDGP